MLSKNYFEQGELWIINHAGKMYNRKEYIIQNGTISVVTLCTLVFIAWKDIRNNINTMQKYIHIIIYFYPIRMHLIVNNVEQNHPANPSQSSIF